jgi:hypothetical protein
MCEAKFEEEILNSQYTKAERYWSLEFGSWVHDCLEAFYHAFRITGIAPEVDTWTKYSLKLWDAYDLSYYKPDPLKLVKDYRTDEKKYHAFGGREGAAAFLIHYYAFYMNQRYRVVATEISFGRKQEVLLGTFEILLPVSENLTHILRVRCYLTGRIDLLVDNTYKIGPVDHKTTASFDGYESQDFDPHEGITGYIYTINAILGTQFPDNPHKICRDGWIHHISTKSTDEPRFKATPINKTPGQLEEFRLRQLRTCKKIVELLNGETADRNTNICNNIYNRSCPYRELHRQPTEQRQGTLRQFYEVREAWNPEKPPSLLRKEAMTKVTSTEKASEATIPMEK